MKKIVFALLICFCEFVFAQSSPGLYQGQIPTAGQWNLFFANKMDYIACGTVGNLWTWNGSTFYCAPPAAAPALTGGTANSVPYQTAPNATAFLPQGVGFFVENAGVPFWLGFGTSINNPGTGTAEALIQTQTITGTSHSFITSDLFQKTRRSNSGTSMTDTFPAYNSTGIANGTQLNVTNVDATATDTITAGSGTTIAGSSTFILQPGRDVWWAYDATNTAWRVIADTSTSVLFTGTPPTATQLFGGSSIPGAASTVSVGTCLSLIAGTLADSCDGTVTSVAMTVPTGMSVSGSPVTGSGTLGVSFATGQTANQFYATPNGTTGAVSLRSIVAADIPTLNQNTTGNAATATTASAVSNTAVTPGSYTNTNLTVGADGRITAASNGSGGGATNYVTETGAYSASVGDNITADTSAGPFSITLPASPSQYSLICITDGAGTFGTNTLTVANNGLKIMGAPANMTVTTNYASFCLIYYNSMNGWRIY